MTMELQQFITQSLVEIMNGVEGAQDRLKALHEKIPPSLSDAMAEDDAWPTVGLAGNSPTAFVEYDIALDVSKVGGEGTIAVAAGGVGGGAYAPRIKFSIPVTYPQGATKRVKKPKHGKAAGTPPAVRGAYGGTRDASSGGTVEKGGPPSGGPA
jgi:hypothetical protein